ncbi:MAG: M48 family metalloprotease [Sedimentisphaerales bacterium]|nr:M48 family metalloprotease [Sedimentisphaerales bacterium]
METLQNIFQAEIIQRLGWTLVHFVWQATAIGLILAVVLKLLHKYSANMRYIIACMALALIVLMPVVTLRMVDVTAVSFEPTKAVSVDLPKSGADTQAVVEMPQAESPPAQVAASPRISLKDKFIEIVEPALPFVVLGWLVGVLALSLWHLGGWTQLQRLRRCMVKQVSERVHLRLRSLAKRLGIRRTVEIMESALVQVPTVVGWIKPVILLPASALTGLTSEQIEAILAHELAHIKRYDYLVNMLQTVVEILGFYHPAVWWISRKIRVERENCCDDLAVSITGDRLHYAKALTTMEEIRANPSTALRTGSAFAVAASGGSLFNRIRRLLGKDSANQGKPTWLPAVIAILLIMALLIPVAFAMNNSQNQKNDTKIKSEIKTLSSSSDAEAERIIQKVLDKYKTMESYSAIGEVISDMDMSGALDDMPELRSEIKDSKVLQDILKKSKKLKHEFSIKLAQPGLYNIEWEQKIHPTFSNTGAVWSSDGKEHFLFNAGRKTSPKDRKWALAMATGVSGGVANTTPSLFFDGQSAILRGLQAVNIRSEEQIDGDRCYVLSGQLAGMTMNFWISKKTLLIRQRQQILSGKFEMPEIPELSDEQIEEALKITGQRITPEAIKEFKEAGKSAPTQMSKIKGIITETHRNIIVNQPINPSEFIPDVNEEQGSDQLAKLRQTLKDVKGPAGQAKQAEGPQEQYESNVKRYREAMKQYESAMKRHEEAMNRYEAVEKSNLEIAQQKIEELQKRIEAANKLSDLGKALAIYANDHEENYPDTLEGLKPYDIDKELVWGLKNVEYLGKDKNITISPQEVIAYDKTLLMQENSQGTNVLYNDLHVAFENPESLERLGISAEEKPTPHILTSAYLLSVPGDLPQLKEIIPTDKSEPGTPMITPEKLEEFLKIIRAIPEAKMISTPKILTNDGETGEMRTENVKDFESIKLKLKNIVQPDRKTIKLELDFEYSVSAGQDVSSTSVSTTAAVLSDHAIAVAGSIPLNGQTVLLLVKPQVLERQSSQTGVVQAKKSAEQANDKAKIQIDSRFLLVPTDANEINNFLEREKIAFPSDKHDPNYTSELDNEQLSRLLKLAQTVKGCQLLSAPKILVFDGEEATLKTLSESPYISGYSEPNKTLDQPQPKVVYVETGILLNVKPTLRSDNENILLHVEFEFSNITGYEKHMYKEKYPYEIPVIHKVVTDTRALFPLGQTILLGGQKITQREKKDGQKVQKVSLCLIKATKLESEKSSLK